MVNIIVELSKYIIIVIIIMYTYLCFAIFGYHDAEKKKGMLIQQNVLMFLLQLIAFIVLYLEMDDLKAATRQGNWGTQTSCSSVFKTPFVCQIVSSRRVWRRGFRRNNC